MELTRPLNATAPPLCALSQLEANYGSMISDVTIAVAWNNFFSIETFLDSIREYRQS